MKELINFIKADPINLDVFLVTLGAALVFIYMLIRLILTVADRCSKPPRELGCIFPDPMFKTETVTRTYAPRPSLKKLRSAAEMAGDVVEAAKVMVSHAQQAKDTDLELKWIAKAERYEEIRKIATQRVKDAEIKEEDPA